MYYRPQIASICGANEKFTQYTNGRDKEILVLISKHLILFPLSKVPTFERKIFLTYYRVLCLCKG